MIQRVFLLFFAAAALSACTAMPANRLVIARESTLPEPSLENIADSVWIHKSYEIIEPWGPILSQGLVVKTEAGVILVDTAWNIEDTEKLLQLIEAELGSLPRTAILTHAHQDKMGGMQALHYAGIQTWAYALTNEDAVERTLIPAEGSFGSTFAGEANDFRLDDVISGAKIESGLVTFIPGPGHTRDNIVVYYGPAKVLFGGCLIRPGNSNNLGNTADADVANWANAVRKVAAEFPEAEIVIPSHGPKGGVGLFDHTIALAEAANE